MIDPHSASYPITVAALAVGVDPGMATSYVWANRQWAVTHDIGWYRALIAAFVEIEAHYGATTAAALQERLEAAIMDGRIYWPVPNWHRWPDLSPVRELPGMVEDDQPDADVPPQPDPIP